MPKTPVLLGMLAALVLALQPVASADPLNAADPVIQAFENGLIDREDRDETDPQHWTIEERLAHHNTPGTAVALIRNGKIVWVKGYGTKLAGATMPIDGDTVFSVGSVSKMINAALILRLVAEGKLDLDTDVNEYLTSWKVSENGYTRDKKVTLRAILSHTAGFSQHGFGDFQPGENLPTAIQTLNGEAPAKHPPVRLMFTPGEMMDYSGGGTTVSQVLVEDVTGLSYPEAAKQYVLDPLGMTRSTFENPLPASHGNIARAHDANGNPAALPRGWEAMPEMAASGLWTSAEDLAAFVIALMHSTQYKDGFLPQALAIDMMTRVPQSWHGLGPRINGAGETHVFHHGGANNSYRAWIQGHLHTGDGIVILTNGRHGSRVGSEIRRSADDAFGWTQEFNLDFSAPEL